MREGYNCLEKRSLRGDVIVVYKIMHGVENVDRETFFSLSHNTKTQSFHAADEWHIQADIHTVHRPFLHQPQNPVWSLLRPCASK